MYRAIQFGIYERPVQSFVSGLGEELGDIPQTAADPEFGESDLMEVCKAGIYRQISAEHAV